MILVRNIFQVKFGRARDAVELWKEGAAISDRLRSGGTRSRILTDVSGVPFYTVVFELEFETLGAYEEAAQKLFGSAEWQAWYGMISPLLEGGHREILSIVA